jgi:uncharacterized membrane protein (UPF0127 family)
MLFRLDIYFLDGRGEVVRAVLGVGPCQIVRHRAAVTVVEIPSGRGE